MFSYGRKQPSMDDDFDMDNSYHRALHNRQPSTDSDKPFDEASIKDGASFTEDSAHLDNLVAVSSNVSGSASKASVGESKKTDIITNVNKEQAVQTSDDDHNSVKDPVSVHDTNIKDDYGSEAESRNHIAGNDNKEDDGSTRNSTKGSVGSHSDNSTLSTQSHIGRIHKMAKSSPARSTNRDDGSISSYSSLSENASATNSNMKHVSPSSARSARSTPSSLSGGDSLLMSVQSGRGDENTVENTVATPRTTDYNNMTADEANEAYDKICCQDGYDGSLTPSPARARADTLSTLGEGTPSGPKEDVAAVATNFLSSCSMSFPDPPAVLSFGAETQYSAAMTVMGTTLFDAMYGVQEDKDEEQGDEKVGKLAEAGEQIPEYSKVNVDIANSKVTLDDIKEENQDDEPKEVEEEAPAQEDARVQPEEKVTLDEEAKDARVITSSSHSHSSRGKFSFAKLKSKRFFGKKTKPPSEPSSKSSKGADAVDEAVATEDTEAKGINMPSEPLKDNETSPAPEDTKRSDLSTTNNATSTGFTEPGAPSLLVKDDAKDDAKDEAKDEAKDDTSDCTEDTKSITVPSRVGEELEDATLIRDVIELTDMQTMYSAYARDDKASFDPVGLFEKLFACGGVCNGNYKKENDSDYKDISSSNRGIKFAKYMEDDFVDEAMNVEISEDEYNVMQLSGTDSQIKSESNSNVDNKVAGTDTAADIQKSVPKASYVPKDNMKTGLRMKLLKKATKKASPPTTTASAAVTLSSSQQKRQGLRRKMMTAVSRRGVRNAPAGTGAHDILEDLDESLLQ